jgi:hypothetical protein
VVLQRVAEHVENLLISWRENNTFRTGIKIQLPYCAALFDCDGVTRAAVTSKLADMPRWRVALLPPINRVSSSKLAIDDTDSSEPC